MTTLSMISTTKDFLRCNLAEHVLVLIDGGAVTRSGSEPLNQSNGTDVRALRIEEEPCEQIMRPEVVLPVLPIAFRTGNPYALIGIPLRVFGPLGSSAGQL